MREEIAAALANGDGHAAEGDRLLNPEEAAEQETIKKVVKRMMAG